MQRTSVAVGVLLTISLPLRAQQPAIANLAWLTGCWELSRGAIRTIEKWNAPAGGQMTGESHTYANGAERESEKLRIFARGDKVVYEALPSGQRLTEYTTSSTASDEIVFSNPEHDFPQRIVYRKVAADSMIARIEGDRAGRRGPVSFAFAKAACTTTFIPSMSANPARHGGRASGE